MAMTESQFYSTLPLAIEYTRAHYEARTAPPPAGVTIPEDAAHTYLEMEELPAAILELRQLLGRFAVESSDHRLAQMLGTLHGANFLSSQE